MEEKECCMAKKDKLDSAGKTPKPDQQGIDNDDLEGRAGDYRAEREIAGKSSRKKEASPG
jgi:hypothetical protein